ncbi:MAG: DNA repair protein RadC [Saprospiraceae bacterium]|nr:MAG: DNA repair protein RadC [Saprospiraceae bacterium]
MELNTTPLKPYPTVNLTIKSWAEEDRPREKLLSKGRHSLSDAELLAILLGSGSRKETAVDLSKRILQSVENDLLDLGKTSLAELMRFNGIGEAKAITIIAALELGRRRQMSNIRQKPQISSSRDAFDVIVPHLIDLPHEEFWILLLNRSNLVTSRERVRIGGIAGTVVDAKIIFHKAIEGRASSIILCHNHPSGNLEPSPADIELTSKLIKAGKTLDIFILDHLIISERGYYSFADEGRI